MNLLNCYQQRYFDKFPNIYAIKRSVLRVYSSGYEPDAFYFERKVDFDTLKIYINLRPDAEKKYVLAGMKRNYLPIYGHFYNNANHFIYKKIFNRKIQDLFEPVKYHIIKSEELAKCAETNYYKCRDIDHLYDTIDRLNAHEIPDIYPDKILIKDVEEYKEIYSCDNLYSYTNEEITEYVTDEQIAFRYNAETGILNMM